MKKLLSLFLTLTLSTSMLVGCGSDPATDEGTTAAIDAEEGDSGEPMEIRILWQQELTESFWAYPIEQFEAAHPEVTVTFESNPEAGKALTNQLNAGDPPDIFYTWVSDVDYWGMIEEGLVYPVDEILAEQNHEGDATLNDTIFKAGIDAGEYDSQHYLLPVTKFLACTFYDKTYTDSKGYTEPKTWEEFTALSDKILADGEATPMVYAGLYPFMVTDSFLMPMMYNIDPASLEAINNNEPGAWMAPAVVDTMERFQLMIDKGYIDKDSLALDHIQSQINFINHKDVFVPVGTWLEGEMVGQWPEEFNLTPMFTTGENASGTSAALTDVGYMILPKQDDTTKQAYITELVQLFYSDENVKRCVEETSYLLAVEENSPEILALVPESVQEAWKLADEKGLETIYPAYKLKYKSLYTELNNNINAMVQGEMDYMGFCEAMDKASQELGQ